MLGLRRNAEEAEISRAYKALALRHHPDKNPGSAEAEVSFKRISEAYAVLRDPAKRREYDRSGGTRSYVSYEEAERMWQSFGGEAPVPEARAQAEVAQQKAVGFAVGLLLLLVVGPRTLLSVLPGVAVAVVGVRWLSSGRGTWRRLCACGCALAFLWSWYVVPWAMRARFGNSLDAQPLEGGAELLRQSAPWAASAAEALTGIPSSGEEEFLNDGTFIRIADPAVEPGTSPAPGWQQRLWNSATAAVRGGEEQVVMVFSREGCPWCDRQVPVLRRAILRRAARQASMGQAVAPVAEEEATQVPEVEGRPVAATACPSGACGPSEAPSAEAPAFSSAFADDGSSRLAGATLLAAPLRVFVLDAGELPELADFFGVQAFPTILAWGMPTAKPLVVQGYLDDRGFDQLLHAAAASGADTGKEEQRRQGLFR